MTNEGPLEKVNPFRDRNVSDQLGAWSAAVEMAVATLTKTLAEFKEFQEKGDQDVGDPGATADTGRTPSDGDRDR